MADMGFLPEVRRILDQIAAGRPAAAVLRHARRRHRHARPALPRRPGDARGRRRRPAPSPRWSTTCCTSRSRGQEARHRRDRRPRGPHDHVRPHEARRRPRWPSSCARDGVRAAALHGGKAQDAAQPGARGVQATGGRPCWSPPTSRPAASTSTTSSLVVNVDPPADHKDYLHRAGRTARAGESGTVVTMVTTGQRRDVDEMTRKAGVRARTTDVAPGAPALVGITGARPPSGVSLIEPARPQPQRSARPKPPRRRRAA